MVKKLKQLAEKQAASSAHNVLNSALASSVKESAHQIWLAGMGAFAKAQEEGGKVFDALVKEGTALQRKTQAVAEERIGEVTHKMTGMAGDVTARAGQQWDKLETIFEERTAKALGKLGVPSAKDMKALTQRIDALSAQVHKLSRSPAAKSTAVKAKAAPTKKASVSNGVAKPAARRAAARKAV